MATLGFVGTNGIHSHPPTYTLRRSNINTEAQYLVQLLLAYFTTSAPTFGHSLKLLIF